MLNYITQLSPKAIAFIDAAVPDCQTLIDGILPEVEAIKLESNGSPIAQITATLQKGKYSLIHIISHGKPGCLQLGNVELNWEKLGDRRFQLNQLVRFVSGSKVRTAHPTDD
jgi:Domain of unknown function (DUF4347)